MQAIQINLPIVCPFRAPLLTDPMPIELLHANRAMVIWNLAKHCEKLNDLFYLVDWKFVGFSLTFDQV